MIPLLCSLLSSVHELRTEVSVLRSGLEALDVHTRVLPTISQLQEVVGDRVTAPLASSLRDLSHRVAGSAPAQAPSLRQPPARPPPARAPPTQAAPSRQTHLLPAQSTGMDLDIPRFDTATKTFSATPKHMQPSSPTRGRPTRTRRANTPRCRPLSQAIRIPRLPDPLRPRISLLAPMPLQLGASRGQGRKQRNVPQQEVPTKSRLLLSPLLGS